MVHLTAARLY